MLVSGKRRRDYKKVLEDVLRILLQSPVVEQLVLDFEAAMWRAAQEVLPHVLTRGCSFHWTQAVYRKETSDASASEIDWHHSQDRSKDYPI